VRFNFLALSILTKQPGIGENDNLFYGFSLGRISYRDDGTVDGLSFFEEGTTIGLSLELGYEYRIKPNYGIGINVGANLARIGELNVPGGTVSNINFDISRIDMTLGFRYYK
jgi:hypothetical protein